jgi:HK97 family phage prohead protease
MNIVAAAPGQVPSVKEVHQSVDGTGLEMTGYFATWDEDSMNEAFVPRAFDNAIADFMRNPVVLYHHKKDEAPIGFVKSCEVLPHGLYGSVILPKPAPGTKAWDIFNGVKDNLIRSFSVGGIWQRHEVGGRVKLFCERLLELSLTPVAINQYALSDGVAAVQGVKAFGTEWVPEHQWDAKQAEALEWLAVQRLKPQLELAELRLDVAAVLLHK